jgi:hypothetical protein
MSLPFRCQPPSAPTRGALTAARAPWSQLVLVCSECMSRRQDVVGEERLPLRKWLKKALKRAGRDDIHVTEAECFDLCPKRGIALACSRELQDRRPLRVYRRGDDPELLMKWLLEEPQPGPAAPPSSGGA